MQIHEYKQIDWVSLIKNYFFHLFKGIVNSVYSIVYG